MRGGREEWYHCPECSQLILRTDFSRHPGLCDQTLRVNNTDHSTEKLEQPNISFGFGFEANEKFIIVSPNGSQSEYVENQSNREAIKAN